MKKEKARLTQLAGMMKADRMSEIRNSEIRNSEIGLTVGRQKHGEKGDFRKVTVTLPPAVYELLVNESSRRKIAGEPEHLLASIVREAVVSHLAKSVRS